MPTPISDINRKYTLNHNYFENIDSAEKAYWLGLIWADGSISKTASRASGKNRLTLTQTESNLKYLSQFLIDIESNKPIIRCKSKTQYSSNQMVKIDLNSRKLCSDLEQLGFDVKSKRTAIPKISDGLIPHFLRGYFDGDGAMSVYVQNYKNSNINRQEFSLTGNPIFIKSVQTYLTKTLDLSETKIKTYKHTEKSVTLRYGKITDVVKLYKFLYKDATRFLPYKHDNFIQFLKNHKGRVSNVV